MKWEDWELELLQTDLPAHALLERLRPGRSVWSINHWRRQRGQQRKVGASRIRREDYPDVEWGASTHSIMVHTGLAFYTVRKLQREALASAKTADTLSAP